VRRGLRPVIEGAFTESTIKELMMDLRALAREIDGATRKFQSEQPQFDSAISCFIEVCDFVAHSIRVKGLVVKRQQVILGLG
jgi:hypothetical protein